MIEDYRGMSNIATVYQKFIDMHYSHDYQQLCAAHICDEEGSSSKDNAKRIKNHKIASRLLTKLTLQLGALVHENMSSVNGDTNAASATQRSSVASRHKNSCRRHAPWGIKL